MSKLIEVLLNDQKTKSSNYGLTEDTFYKQIESYTAPAIYIELGAITSLSFQDGILTINNTVYNMFSRHIIDVVEAVRSNGGNAWLVSAQIALYPALFLNNIQTQEFLEIQVDKSPLLISDFIPKTINNLISLDPSNISFNVVSVFDENEQAIDFTYIADSKNLYTSKLGNAIVQSNIKNFFVSLNTDRLVSTKSLIKNPINLSEFEKSLIINTALENHNIFYE